MPDDFGQLLGLGTVAADHDVSRGLSNVYSAALTQGQVAEAFRSEFTTVQNYISANAQAYLNRRTAEGITTRQSRIISSVGRDQLYTLGLPRLGPGQPIFEWYAPTITEGVLPLREEITFVVMHSFGRGLDLNALRAGQRTIAIDANTGHSPARFFAGIRQLTTPEAATPMRSTPHPRNGIHHIVSLRGDLVNSVPWDTSCYHGEGSNGQYPNLRVNPRSIGIEHEEWYAFPAGATAAREIEDHGPYNESVYAADAFIIKKLEAYTGRDFKVFLGVGETARNNIRNNRVGCFNHADTSNHQDPGAEFLLPPDYELRVTNLRTIPGIQDNVAAWSRRLDRWYRGIPTGTQISAYGRIFNIARRLRNYNLQTEVFDPARGVSLINKGVPRTTGIQLTAAAQQAAADALTAIDRAARLTATPRSGLYNYAQDTAAAITTALARQSGRLGELAERAIGLPVITNALGFDFRAGVWVNRTSITRTSQAESEDIDPATTDTPASSAVPSGAVSATPQRGRWAMFGSSSSSRGNALPPAVQRAWSVDLTPTGRPSYTVARLASSELPDFSVYDAVLIYVPGSNGVASVAEIRRLHNLVRTNSGYHPVYWAPPPLWPTTPPTPTDAVFLAEMVTRNNTQAANLQAAGVPLITTNRPQLTLADLISDLTHLSAEGAAKVAAAWPKPSI